MARHRRLGRILAAVIVLVNVLVDASVIEESLDAERGMVHRVWHAMPGIVILAAVLIVVWQVLPVAVLVFGRRAALSPEPRV